jgi:hypothetical protein
MNRKLLASFTLAMTLAAGLGTAHAAAPRWPTLKQQLEKDRVIPGSALEKLIRENQDFRLLNPAELDKRTNLPLWLKVFWRKSNPHLEYLPEDPTGGYPHALNELYEWMLTHQDLRPGRPERDRGEAKVISESGEQRISGAQFSRRSESDIRVNYWNSNQVVAGSNNISGSGQQAQFYSTNGGVSWGQSYLPFAGSDVAHSDPAVDWTSDGVAWSVTMGFSGGTARLRSYRSFDGGATWSWEGTPSGSQTGVDKELIWVDHSNSSPYKNNVYAIWHTGRPVFMNRRVASTGLWQTPIQVSSSETTNTGIGADVKTNSAGHVFGFWPDTGSRGIYVIKSTNGGASYASRVRLATTYASYEIPVPAFAQRRALIYVTAGTFKNPARDNVYAAWTDLTGVTGCNSSANSPGTNTASSCKSRIWFSRSTNGGASWETPRMINNQASLNDQFNPWLVVDETTGAMSIIYYDTVADPGRRKTHVYYQSSFDDGISWNPPFQVTTAQTDETLSGADLGNQYGDYNGLSGYAALFFPSWTDRRSGGPEEIWSAAMSDPVPPGNPFVYDSVSDMYQACMGIASRDSSYCYGVANADDRNMCLGLAQGSQTPCTDISVLDRNLQLACYGMSMKPNYPSNCRDITDVNMRNLCYAASGAVTTDIGYCTPITWRNTQLLCFALNNNVSSNCWDITVPNDRNFCFAVSGHTPVDCGQIQ